MYSQSKRKKLGDRGMNTDKDISKRAIPREAWVRGIEQKSTSEYSVIHFRVMEEPLTTHNLITILSATTDLATKCWLIAHQRFADLIEYSQTHDVRFVEETQLHITKLTHNSPLVGSFKIDLSASNVAEAIVTAIEGVTQAKARLEKAQLENEAKAQEIAQAKQKAEQEGKESALELERKELAIERERLEILEKRLDVQKKGIEYALEIASKTIAVLHPNADEQTKAMLIQDLLPAILQLQSSKGLELVLPSPQDATTEQNN
jgi:hypothetical protein